jgi:NADH dehydrogenase
MSENTDVVVIGGGYAGVLAANRLTQRDDVTVTLINPRSTFVERIRLHQLVGGSSDAAVDYREVLGEGIRLVVDTVTRIDAAERSVALATSGTVGYDYLIYAVGSVSDGSRVPGAAEFAYPVATLEAAERLRSVLDAAPATTALTVVGAGPQGIETAAELAELGRTVTLVCGGVLGPYLHPWGRRSVAGRLAKLGVTVFEGPDTKVMAVTRDAVQFGDGRELPSAVTIWTAGFGVPDLAARSGLSTDALRRLLTDETLTSVDDVRIVAAGDSAAPSDLPFRMSCQAAIQLGPLAADTVLSRIAGEQPAPILVGFYGQCISLGRRAAVFQVSRSNDAAIRLYVGGRPGAMLKEFFCKGAVKQAGGRGT